MICRCGWSLIRCWDLADGRWKIVANTLGDLTKRENRYEHHFFDRKRSVDSGSYPYAVASTGSGYNEADTFDVQFVFDPEVRPMPSHCRQRPSPRPDEYRRLAAASRHCARTMRSNLDNSQTSDSRYAVRPFAYVDEDSTTRGDARGRCSTTTAKWCASRMAWCRSRAIAAARM